MTILLSPGGTKLDPEVVDQAALQAVVQLQHPLSSTLKPDGTFRGNRAMTRYEFAAALNAAPQ